MPGKRRLIWQLYPTYLLIIVISLVAAIWVASRTMKQFYLEQNAKGLEASARLFEMQVSEYINNMDENGISELCKKIGQQASTRLTVILPSGRVVGDSKEDPEIFDNHVDRPEIIKALRGEVGVSVRYSRTLEQDMMYVGIPLKRGPNIIGVVRTSIPLTPIDETLKEIEFKIVLGGLLIAIISAIMSLLFSLRISRPVEEIKRVAEAFSNGDFDHRIPESNTEELGSLIGTMNQMAVELQRRINLMREQRNELEAVLSSMVEGVIAVDNDEKIIRINNAAAQMLEAEPSVIQNRSIQEVVRNTDLQNFVRIALSSTEAVELDILLHGESERIINGHSTVLCDTGGKIIGALLVLNDVTHLRRLENIRKDFVANVSHEIKTPITAIKGFVETLRDGALGDRGDAKRFLDIIAKHVDRLDAIIEDLLSLSRIEQDVERDMIVLKEVMIRDVLFTAVQICQAKADSRNISLELSCEEALRARINAPLLEQAVVNLLDNAIKYSEAGTAVKITADEKDKDIMISVRDQGCGIEEKHLSRLFERFYRVDKARSRKAGGTGLGLSIVKHVVQAHRGRIDVNSIPGKGSTFSIYLPAF
ncbi:MAG: HAMP domain-containing protein [Deltaproteobacteria bacterium]|nr:HAMP domain-containing protein [Deltaproteobacteria bacterium]